MVSPMIVVSEGAVSWSISATETPVGREIGNESGARIFSVGAWGCVNCTPVMTSVSKPVL